MLELEGVTVRAGEFALAADLTVARGTRVAVMGPSGAGKSTLLAGIAGFAETVGAILWDGSRIDGLAPGRRPAASLFQEGNLFPHLTAARNVALGIRPDGRLDAAGWERVAEALGRVGLEGLEDRRPDALSGGQRARVALARVSVQSKPLILLDEAFSALGPALRAEMLDLTAGHRGGRGRDRADRHAPAGGRAARVPRDDPGDGWPGAGAGARRTGCWTTRPRSSRPISARRSGGRGGGRRDAGPSAPARGGGRAGDGSPRAAAGGHSAGSDLARALTGAQRRLLVR